MLHTAIPKMTMVNVFNTETCIRNFATWATTPQEVSVTWRFLQSSDRPEYHAEFAQHLHKKLALLNQI